MLTINPQLYTELENLTIRIENNSANLKDYLRYEQILINAGLPREYIFSYLQRAGFSTWQEFINARNIKQQIQKEKLESLAIGGLIGIGIGLLLSSKSEE